MPVSLEQFQVPPANIWDMDQDEENAYISGMEGLDNYNEDTYPKWDVDILRFNCVNQLCL